MGVDQTSLDRIRNATFPSARRGYDKREVEKFLARLADWLETGAGDESRSDTVKRELERVGQRTGAILAQAEESAQQIRGEAEEEARQAVAEANATAEQTRTDADAYARKTRSDADREAEAARAEADKEAAEAIEQAQAQARRIVEEGNTRRQDIESVIADLVERRNWVLGDIEELGRKLEGVVTEHRPEPGAESDEGLPGEEPELGDEDVDVPAPPEEDADEGAETDESEARGPAKDRHSGGRRVEA